MKKILLSTFLFFAFAFYANAQSCHGSEAEAAGKSGKEFSNLAEDANFVNEHLNPEALDIEGKKGKMITYKVADGADANAYYIKAKKKTNKYLLVIHEWWGLNAHIKQEALNWAKDLGVNVLALDLYDGKVATTREDAAKYMQAVESERAVAIVKGALAFAGDDAEIATIGWCFGGGWSMQSAIIAGEQTLGCVMYYGMPEKDVERIKMLNTDVLAVFASQDKWINEQVATEFKANMEAAGKDLELLTYGAAHAFANPSNPVYDKEKADDANGKALAYLKKRFDLD